MKFLFPTVVALASFATTSMAAAIDVVDKRAVVTFPEFMNQVTTQVKQHTDALNKITAAVPADATDAEKKESADSAIVEINEITAIIQEAQTKVNGAHQANNKRQARQPTLGDLPRDVLGQLDGRPIVLARLLLPLLQELNPAIGSVLRTLYLGEVYLALQPLLRVQLPALVVGLSNLVSGLLVALAPLLTALGGILGPLLLGLGL